MTVYKDPRSPYWQYDFQINGRRFHGSTKAPTERDAEAVERAVRERTIKNPFLIQQRNGKPKSKRKPQLYIIRATGTTQFKFGLAVKPTSRLSDLRVGSCMPLELVSAIEIAAAEIERELHRALAPWHSHGEWFDLGVDTDAFLAKVRSDGLLAALRTLHEPPPVPADRKESR
jgi:Meiotically Up-regulated Gene 113 (MUG113) protein